MPESLEAFDSPLRRYAAVRDLPYSARAHHGPLVDNFIDRINPDAIAVAGMYQLLKPVEYDAARHGAVNLHASLLPRYRGPQPLFWQFHEMDLAGGVTVHQVDAGIDSGDILAQSAFNIVLGASYDDVLHEAAERGAGLLRQTLDQIAAGTATPRPQSAAGGGSGGRGAGLLARVPEGEDLVPRWNEWSLDHTWHFLRGLQADYRILPPPAGGPGGAADAEWEVGERVPGDPPEVAPGTIAEDRAGYFVAHPAGRIRLALQSPPGPLEQQVRRMKAQWDAFRLWR